MATTISVPQKNAPAVRSRTVGMAGNRERIIYNNMVERNIVDSASPVVPVQTYNQVKIYPVSGPSQTSGRASSSSSSAVGPAESINARNFSSWADADATIENFEEKRRVLRNEDRLMYVMTDMLHPMVVNGLVFLDRPMELTKLEELAQWLLIEHPVLTSVIHEGQWRNQKELAMKDHITITQVEEDVSMEAKISEIVSSELRMDIPMWHLHLVVHESGGQYVLVVRVHHCIGDGVALMTLLDKLLKREEPSADQTLLKRRKVPWYIKLLRVVCIVFLAPLVAIQLLFMRRDPKSCFRVKTQRAKVVTWLNPMSLKEINIVGKKIRATVNDVLCSVTAGALSRYLEITSGRPFKKDLKCIVPFSVRSWPERFDLNNRVSAIFIHLPVACHDAVKRMRLTKKRMDRMKSGAWVPVTVMLNRVTTSTMSTRICRWLQNFYASKCTLVFSNVRSAATEAELMGYKVKSVMGFVPLPGELSLGITMVSYNDQILLGIVANPDALHQPNLLADQFLIEFNALKAGIGIETDPEAALHESTFGAIGGPHEAAQADQRQISDPMDAPAPPGVTWTEVSSVDKAAERGESVRQSEQPDPIAIEEA